MLLSKKFHLLLLFISMGFTQSFYAQKAINFNAGASIGLCASQVDGDKSAGYHKVGLRAAIFSSAKLNDRTKLYLDLSFIQKGSRHKAKYLDFSIQLNYFEIPVSLLYILNDKWELGGGLSYAYLFNQSVSDNSGSVNLGGNYYRKSDINLIARILYHINHKWSADLRFAYSALSIYDKTPKLFNNLININLQYQF